MKKFLLLLSFIACIFLFAQESVTKKYLDTDDLKIAKSFSKTYHDTILSKKYTIRNLGNPETNIYDVEYKLDDDNGFTIMVVNYNFRERDFTILLKSINYQNKKTGEKTALTNQSTIESVRNYCELTKKILVTLQANYIAPDLND